MGTTYNISIATLFVGSLSISSLLTTAVTAVPLPQTEGGGGGGLSPRMSPSSSSDSSDAAAMPASCVALPDLTEQCACCKDHCWQRMTVQAEDSLGHQIGSDGEDEALSVLFAIKRCVQSRCADACNVRRRKLAALKAFLRNI